MPVETTQLNTKSLLPAAIKWFGLVSNQTGEPITLIHQDRELISPEFITQAGVRNIVAYSVDLRTTEILNPVALHQKYTAPDSRYGIELNLTAENIDVGFDIYNIDDTKPHKLDWVNIQSSIAYDKSLRKWHSKNSVFLKLGGEYLEHLKERWLLPADATVKIWITIIDGQLKQEIACINPRKGEADLIVDLPDSALSPILIDSGLQVIGLYEGNGKITGSIGNISFSLDHARTSALDPEGIWNTLTGTQPDRKFIFPVDVTIAT